MSIKLLVLMLLSGLTIGSLDGLAACLHAFAFSKVLPVDVFQYIASGIYGRDAFDKSTAMFVRGLAFHFIIAIVWTSLYFWLYMKTDFTARHLLASGAGYGLLIWIVMTFLVVPLSNAPELPLKFWSTLAMALIHMALGIFISLLAHKLLQGFISNDLQ